MRHSLNQGFDLLRLHAVGFFVLHSGNVRMIVERSVVSHETNGHLDLGRLYRRSLRLGNKAFSRLEL